MCWVDREEEVGLARKLITGEPEAFNRSVEHFRAKLFPSASYSFLHNTPMHPSDAVSRFHPRLVETVSLG